MFSAAGIQKGERVIQDRLGLLVFRTDPKGKFLFLSGSAASVGTGMEGLIGTLQSVREGHHGPWTDEQKLAYELLHASLFDSNPETRYIQLVTAVEALLPNGRKVPFDIANALDELVTVIANRTDIEKSVRDRVAVLLRQGKKESISRLGAQLAGTLSGDYGNQAPQKYFREAYGIRSNLVHGNPKRVSSNELSQRYSELVKFVLDLLDAATRHSWPARCWPAV